MITVKRHAEVPVIPTPTFSIEGLSEDDMHILKTILACTSNINAMRILGSISEALHAMRSEDRYKMDIPPYNYIPTSVLRISNIR